MADEAGGGPRPYPAAPYRAARLAGIEAGRLELGVACLAGLLPVREVSGLGRSARRSVPGPGLWVEPELGLARGEWRLMSDSSRPLIPMESGGGPTLLETS